MLLIGISGKARAGKDLLYSIYTSRGFKKASFAHLLKMYVIRDFGLTNEHVNGWLKDTPCRDINNHTPRELLIEYGNLFRKYAPDYWVEALFNSLSPTCHDLHTGATSEAKYMITDVRYPNEAEAIRKSGGLLVRLERPPSREGMMDPEQINSPSETALDEYMRFDLVLPAEDNATPQDLEKFALKIDELIKTVEHK